MADRFAVQDMSEALRERTHPTVPVWNRIEGRPRTVDLQRALRTEVRDALWMLTRQWQVGEFVGEDAGSPVFAKLHVATTRLTRFQAGSASARDFDVALPLETQIERQPLQLSVGRDKIGLDLRLAFGRRWLRQIAPIGGYAQLFITKYRIETPDPGRREDAAICAHPEVWQSFAAAAGRAMDGVALYDYLSADPTRHAYDGVAVLETDKSAIDEEADKFLRWIRRTFSLPEAAENPAWHPQRLEYRFSCSAQFGTEERIFAADEYYSGTADWASVDRSATTASLGEPADKGPSSAVTRTTLPVPLAYPGMPHPRWWTMEDSRTNFGEIRPDTTDLAKLLLIEFGLIYSNDWFIVPITLPASSINDVRGLVVTTVFGERFWIEPAGSKATESWQRWSIFTHDLRDGDGSAPETSLLFLPTARKAHEGTPHEEVLFIRDEMANMVWAVEKTIPAPDGEGRSGPTAGRETRAYHERLVAQAPAPTPAPLLENDAKIRYDLMGTVPEHWIPFIPAYAPGSQRLVELQRASVPRLIQGDPVNPPALVRPRTTLLRFGLDSQQPQSYLVPEEEVPRSGIRVTKAFRRTRWTDGKAVVWLSVRKQTGRGEGSSGLSFDRLLDNATNSGGVV